jgi:hypothetical protein
MAVRPPSAELAPFVISVGHYQARRPDGRELLLPTGCMLLIVNMAEEEARWYDGPGFAAVRTAPGAVLVSAAAGPIGADLARWGTVVGAAIRPGAAGASYEAG